MRFRGIAPAHHLGLLLCLGCMLSEAAAQTPQTNSERLARLRQLQSESRWAESDSLAQAWIQELESTANPDSLDLAHASLALAQARWKLASLSDGTALAAAQQALRIRSRALGRDHLDVAAAHTILGRVLSSSDQADSAFVHVSRAIEIREPQLPDDDPLLADNWSQLGAIERTRKNVQPALTAFERAAEMLRRRYPEGHRDLALAIADIGNCLTFLDETDRAREVLQESLVMLRQTVGPDAPELHYAYNYAATNETESGNLARAIEMQQEALRILRLSRPEDDLQVATIRANVGNALTRLGDYPGARAVYRQILPIFTRHFGPTHARTLALRCYIGIACGGMQAHEEALTHLRAVESELLKRSGTPPSLLGICLRFQGEVLHLQGEHAAARAVCERGIAAERQGQRPFSESLIAMHYLLLSTLEALGNYAALDSARIEVNRLAEEYKIAGTGRYPTLLYWNARVDRDLGNFEAAWSTILTADRLARERVRDNVRALPDRRALEFARQQSRYLDLLLDLSAQGSPQQIELAWDRLVQMRGLVREEVESRRLPLDLRNDSELMQAHVAWRTAQQQFARRLVDVGRADDDSLLSSFRAQAEESERRYVQTLASRRREPMREANLAAVRARLPRQAALVSVAEIYATSDTTSVLAFVARGDSDKVERLSLGRSAKLREAIEAWRDELQQSPLQRGANAEAESRRLGAQVRALCWEPLAAHLAGIEDVYLVADGPLLELPWQALPEGKERYCIESGPRMHLLQAERELLAPAISGTGTLLAIGAPDFDGDIQSESAPGDGNANLVLATRANPSPCAELGALELEPLPATEREARQVAAAWEGRDRRVRRSQLLLGPEASEAALKRLAAGREILHIATHGVVVADSCASASPGTRGVGGVSVLQPASSTKPAAPARPSQVGSESIWADRNVWIAFAGANRAAEHEGDENEGILTAEEVVTLDLSGTRWVVLSACHSAAGAAWSREGTAGMRRAFHLAGARTVIASQWAVEDESAREWMTALYAAPAGSAAEALQSASRQILEQRRREQRSTHPFYWAAFSASGE